MDIIGTISVAIALVDAVKAIFDQVGQNKHDCVALSTEVVKSLLKVETFWEQHSLSPPTELHDSLSEFEAELRVINKSLESLIKPTKERLLSLSITKVTEIYNVDSIKAELTSLRQKVQTCQQQLQTWSTLRTESRVAAIQMDVIALREDLRMLMPRFNPQRRASLEHVEQELPALINVIDTNGSLRQELLHVQSRNSLHAAPSIKSSKFSVRSLSPSFIETRYLRDKIKEISNRLPQACNGIFSPDAFTMFNQFRGLDNISSSMSRSDSVKETLRILEVLQSGKQVPYIETAKDLLRLGGALRILGMADQASRMYEWGVQICCKLAAINSPKASVHLIKLLHRLSLNLDRDERFIDAKSVFEHAVKARCMLRENGRQSHFTILASFLTSIIRRMEKASRFQVCCRLMKEAVEVCDSLRGTAWETHSVDLSRVAHRLGICMSEAGMLEDAVAVAREGIALRRELVKQDHQSYLSDLCESLHNLARYLYAAGRPEEAIKAGEETVKMYRELVERDRETYLSDLCFSLTNLAKDLDEVGKTEEAVKLGEEVVVMWRELAEKDRRSYLPILSLSVSNHAVYLDVIGRTVESVEAGKEAVMMRRELVEKDRDTYLPKLGHSLRNLGWRLHIIGRIEESVTVGEEAVEVFRELVKEDYWNNLPQLSASLDNLALFLNTMERFEEALKIGEETVEMAHDLVRYDRKIYLPHLSALLHSLSFHMKRIGNWEKSIKIREDAVKASREAAEMGSKNISNLIRDLENFTKYLRMVEHENDACEAEEEIFQLRQCNTDIK